MLKDLTQVLNEIGLKLRPHETFLLIAVLAACVLALLFFGYVR